MKNTYDHLATGDRLRSKRILLGMNQDEMAEKINRATKYYADIERGNCGMSIETMLALSDCLNMSLDYMIYGDIDKKEETVHTDEVTAIMNLLSSCSKQKRIYAMRILKLFLIACDSDNDYEHASNDTCKNAKK